MVGTKIVEDNEGHLSVLMILTFRSIFKGRVESNLMGLLGIINV